MGPFLQFTGLFYKNPYPFLWSISSLEASRCVILPRKPNFHPFPESKRALYQDFSSLRENNNSIFSEKMIFLLLSISLLSFLSNANDNSILYFEIHHPEGIIQKIINPFSTVLFYRYCVQLQRKICTRFRRNIWAIYVSRAAHTCKEPIWKHLSSIEEILWWSFLKSDRSVSRCAAHKSRAAERQHDVDQTRWM